MKRKTLQDYFETTRPAVKKSRLAGAEHELPLKETILQQVPGLATIQSFITPEEEALLLKYVDSLPWRTDLSRRTYHFGDTYCLMPPKNCTPAQRKRIETTTIKAPPIPDQLSSVLDRMVSAGLYSADMRPAYCIVNEYTTGLGISAHVENFRFGEPVCSLTLAGNDTMRFHELTEAHDGSVRSGKAVTAPRTGRREDIQLDRRSLLILRGDARSSWQHEIVRGRGKERPLGWRRVSLTFRVDRKTAATPLGNGPRTRRQRAWALRRSPSLSLVRCRPTRDCSPAHRARRGTRCTTRSL